ncbi:methyltransferase domain-containing protein [Edaphobacter sp. 12200R-103]|nr:methyltransferase domain-containing protein [Edaphobacter sp. 12200R-103]
MAQDTLISSQYAALNGFRLRCPRCAAPFEWSEKQEESLLCVECHFPMSQKDKIWRALPIERATYYARFIKDYEAIRTAEGRGSADSSYYLRLPFATHSDHNAEQWKIRAATYRYFKQILLPQISSNSQGAGNILDIGAGNGWLSYRLSQAGMIVVAIDLLTNTLDGLGAASHYDTYLKCPFLRIQAESDRLPLCDAQFDAVIFNASFHYAENYLRTLHEALRCLRPGGMVIIADSPWYAHEDSGWKMLAERRSQFFNRFGIFSDSICSQEFLTDERLDQLAHNLGIRWERHTPFYGLRWYLRPLIAKLKGKREPSTFRIYVAKKPA